jgi:hypothetical protein
MAPSWSQPGQAIGIASELPFSLLKARSGVTLQRNAGVSQNYCMARVEMIA